MKFELNVEKRHLYVISLIIALIAVGVFVVAVAPNPGHDYKQLDLGPIDLTTDDGKVILKDRNVEIKNDLIVEGTLDADFCLVDKGSKTSSYNDEEGEITEASCIDCGANYYAISGFAKCYEEAEESISKLWIDDTGQIVSATCVDDHCGRLLSPNSNCEEGADYVQAICARINNPI